MHEPRGHNDMYGVILVEPDHPDADLAVLFCHNEGYSTMCGHATIAVARWAVDTGLVAAVEPRTTVGVQCPCGLVTAHVQVRDGPPGPRALRERGRLRAADRCQGRGGGRRHRRGRHRLRRRLLRLRPGGPLRSRRAHFFGAVARGRRLGGHLRGQGATRTRSPRARGPGLPLRDHPHRRRLGRRPSQRQRVRLRGPPGRPQPHGKRRHRPHGHPERCGGWWGWETSGASRV